MNLYRTRIKYIDYTSRKIKNKRRNRKDFNFKASYFSLYSRGLTVFDKNSVVEPDQLECICRQVQKVPVLMNNV